MALSRDGESFPGDEKNVGVKRHRNDVGRLSDRRRGSSDGEGGRNACERSTSGGSLFTWEDFNLVDVFRLLDFWSLGVSKGGLIISISLGGVNRSLGGSYAGVMDRDRIRHFRLGHSPGGMKSACTLFACTDL